MHVTPAMTYESISDGPATLWAAAPVATKIPAPMIAPTPSAESCTGPRTRRRRFSPAISSRSSLSGLRAKRGFDMGGTLGRGRNGGNAEHGEERQNRTHPHPPAHPGGHSGHLARLHAILEKARREPLSPRFTSGR